MEFARLNRKAFFFTEPQTCYRTLIGLFHEPLSQDGLKIRIVPAFFSRKTPDDQRFPLKYGFGEGWVGGRAHSCEFTLVENRIPNYAHAFQLRSIHIISLNRIKIGSKSITTYTSKFLLVFLSRCTPGERNNRNWLIWL